MAEIRARGERFIPAPAGAVYGYIADYHRHHPNILPKAFTRLSVEEGGVGARTVFCGGMKMGIAPEQIFRMRVSEPEPGRVLRETDLDTGLVTTFTVAPQDGGCTVSIDTVWTGHGLRGLVERLFAPRFLEKLYAQELQMLEQYARSGAREAVSAS